MPIELDLKPLVGMQESPSTLVRFEDDTDKHAPRLSYSVPLPGSFEGRYYMQIGFANLPWKPAAFRDLRTTPSVKDLDVVVKGDLKSRSADTAQAQRLALTPGFRVAAPRTTEPQGAAKQQSKRKGRDDDNENDATALMSPGTAFHAEVVQRGGAWTLETGGLSVAWNEVAENAKAGRALVLYRSLGGSIRHTYKQEAKGKPDARPRFVIIEHYRMSSFFGDYGAGKTLSVFSLMPGEETRLYIRNWRRSEEKKKEASSVFDSFTQEAADDFTDTMESENTDRESLEKAKSWHVKASASCNFGIGVVGGSASVEGGAEGSSKSARESMSKSVAKATTHHASKASSKRDISVTTELEATEAQEFEAITERTVKNINLSRTLNIVTRELNQEFTTYLALVDVTIAFVNDLNVFDEYRIHEIDRMLRRYLPPPPADPGKVVVNKKTPESAYTRVRRELLRQIRTVYDYQGVAQEFLEEAPGIEPKDPKYLRVRRANPGEPNPFHGDSVPVEGVVMNVTRQTVRTDAVIIDSLLGHGVALDNYALGTQQETMLQKQLENRKIELALKLIESGDEKGLEGYRSIFGSVDNDLLKQVALD